MEALLDPKNNIRTLLNHIQAYYYQKIASYAHVAKTKISPRAKVSLNFERKHLASK
jgi:hypothetical protein